MEEFYTLPEITFVAGERQTIVMNLWTPKPNAEPFNVNSCTINFSVINYSNKYGTPIISKICVIQNNEDNIPCIAITELLPLETVTLFGKYIYQITIVDIDGNTEIPNQGIIYIVNNINQGFIQNQILWGEINEHYIFS